jgi:hypothetical protein
MATNSSQREPDDRCIGWRSGVDAEMRAADRGQPSDERRGCQSFHVCSQILGHGLRRAGDCSSPGDEMV